MRRVLLWLGLAIGSVASKWPYDRFHGSWTEDGRVKADPTRPEFNDRPANEFGQWLHQVLKQGNSEALTGVFKNDTLPKSPTFDKLLHALDVPKSGANDSFVLPPSLPSLPAKWSKVAELFKHLDYPLDQNCLSDDFKWRFRTYDGSCNWLKAGESDQGQFGAAHARDYDQHEYADGVSSPREGPNPRAVSNAFFRRNQSIYYEHTPFLLGLIEFIIHDISYSIDSETEWVDVPVPPDEEDFPLNTTFRIMRTEKVPGTGTSKENPRENINRATTWLDISALYGSSQEVARKLRSYHSGKLLTQEVHATGTTKPASYLPFNTMNVPTRTRPGVRESELFAGGDPRTNEDWIMLAVHTLLLREHNRMCDILAKQHPEYDDEHLYQTVRLLMSAKFAMIANAYQMAYWTDTMPWPRDDGFPLYREMYGKDYLEINPVNTYPWPLVTKNGKPMTVSAEMAIGYRFHEFIIPTFPIIDASNSLVRDQNLFYTGFDAKGFLDTGLENIIRGIGSTHIPNFKSGVDESFRSADRYRGKPFDIVTWSIVHEREQGLPTFNQYFREYNKQDPVVHVPIRKRFEEFTSNPVHVAALKRLYKNVDEVDLTVGCQLDEEMFPNTTVPKSSLIISLFSLFGMGNSDRFSVGFAAMRCLLVDKPWDCHPSNALEEILWKPMPREGFPNFRFYDTFWMTELDLQAHGTNLLWRLVTENTEIKCLQKDPLFPVDPVKNPIMCKLPPQKVNIKDTVVSFLEIGLNLLKQYQTQLLATLSMFIPVFSWFGMKSAGGTPPVMSGWPIVGEALSFQKDAKKLILSGFKKFGASKSSVFGMKLASLTNYVLSNPKDLNMMLDDNPTEVKFNLKKLFESLGIPIVVRKENFASDVHTKLVKLHLRDEATVAAFGVTMQHAVERFLDENPLLGEKIESIRLPSLFDYMNRLITSVHGRAMIGPDALTLPGLIPQFVEFNETVDKVMGLAMMLPSFLQFIPKFMMDRTYSQFRKVLVPIIKRRRVDSTSGTEGLLDFMPFVLKAVDDDNQASGLRNLESTVFSTLLDIYNEPELPSHVASSLRTASTANLHTFGTDPGVNTPWAILRSCMFESIRLCGPGTGPARIISSPTPVPLASDPNTTLPPGQIATLSSFYSHRMPINYGKDAAQYRADRFLNKDPAIGSTSFIAWGLEGPHLCPGRWFAQESICILTKALLDRYEFVPAKFQDDDEKYIYHAGVVTRNEVPVTVTRRRA